ncbi:sushi, von Willebrand factor type a, egf and pentraxin domain-containing protein 1 [Plakobranchus ocellatus]|uniref:Sushi, von Willebrand factor type a, egf and pentraxin domain-containing protein 1 n=1 Tax=Plakobranchus ocellatus TaxID=259542 RepID=A0AAV4BR42_9GAST|nr:sushi, von Willebrand factor type a, egf and pentraxin domain-containing protein 1 [Plakobranchus ocellatus]
MAGAVSTSPAMVATCQDTGRWSPLPAPCSVVSCGQPPKIDAMDVDLTDRSQNEAYPGLTADDLKMAYGGEAVYTCEDGYVAPEGSRYIAQCQADGTWSSTAGFYCSPVDCGAPPRVLKASHIMYSKTTLGKQATVYCQPAHLPLEGITLTCNATGNWDGGDAMCRLIDCGPPKGVKDAVVNYDATTVNAMANYECNEPTVKLGEDNSTSMCQENGEWSPVSLTCTIIPCGHAPSVDNANVTYLLLGTHFLAAYSCNHGFYMESGLNTRLCVDVWSINEIICAGVSCGQPPVISHALVDNTNYSFPSSVTYTCQQGYLISSAVSTKECTVTGQWSEEEVTCDSKMCDLLTLPDNTKIASSAEVKSAPLQNEDVILLECFNGTVMALKTDWVTESNVLPFVCQNGTWESLMMGTDILCVPEDCPRPADLPHTSWELEMEDNLLKITYECVEGYTWGTDRQAFPTSENQVASDGIAYCHAEKGWDLLRLSGKVCVPVQCGTPSFEEESGLQVSSPHNTAYMSKAEVTCKPPLYQNNTTSNGSSLNNIIVCQADGQWSTDSFTLTCAPCNQSAGAAGIPNSILRIEEFGEDTIIAITGEKERGKENSIGNTASIHCEPGFVLSVTPGTIQCESINGNPTWTGLDNVTCLQNEWTNPVMDGKEYVFPMYVDLVSRGFHACLRLKLTFAGRFKLFLMEDMESPRLFAARVIFYKEMKDKVDVLKFSHTKEETRPVRYVDSPLLDLALLEVGEEATLCLNLNLIDAKYQLTKNGKEMMVAPAKRYKSIKFLVVEEDIEVFDVNISYF